MEVAPLAMKSLMSADVVEDFVLQEVDQVKISSRFDFTNSNVSEEPMIPQEVRVTHCSSKYR